MSIPGILPPAAWGDSGSGSTMIQTLQSLGLTSGLQLCLDAGDSSSYSGSGQTWADVSGNSNNFYRGATSSSEGSDPSFNGAAGAGAPINYWSVDGGDYFTLAGSNPSSVNSLHKDNAKWAFAFWIYTSSLPAVAGVLFGDNKSNHLSIGVSSFVRADGTLRVSIVGGVSGLDVLLITSSATVTTGAWNFLAGQIDEAAGTGFLQVNGTQEDETSTYTTPSSAAASYTLEIARDGGGGGSAGPMPSGWKLSSAAIWQATVPSKTSMLALYNAMTANFH